MGDEEQKDDHSADAMMLPQFIVPPQRTARIAEELLEEYGTEEQLAALYGAIAAAQANFGAIKKDRTVVVKKNGQELYRYNYAPMENCLDATRPQLSAEGVAVLFPPSKGGAGADLEMRMLVAHKEGGRLVITFRFGGGGDIKDQGGAMTYVQRYVYTKTFNLAADEDADDMPAGSGGDSTEVQQGKRREAPTPAKKKASARASKDAPEVPPENAPPPTDDDAPDAPVGGSEAPQQPAEDGDAGPLTEEQSEELGQLVAKLGIKRGPMAKLCQEVTGAKPQELTKGTGRVFIAHLREKVENA